MTPSVAALAVAAAVCAWPAPPPPVLRLQRVVGAAGPSRSAAPRPRPPLVLFGVAAAVVAVLAGMPWWLLAAAALTAALAHRSRRPGGEGIGDVPLVADLLGSCLAAGAPLAAALDAAARAGGPELRALTARALDRLRRGLPEEQVWAEWLAHEELGTLARTLLRTSRSGAAATREIGVTAARLRARRAAAVEQRLARAGVWVVLPLGLCFLPAFVLVGVVPVALGLLGKVQ